MSKPQSPIQMTVKCRECGTIVRAWADVFGDPTKVKARRHNNQRGRTCQGSDGRYDRAEASGVPCTDAHDVQAIGTGDNARRVCRRCRLQLCRECGQAMPTGRVYLVCQRCQRAHERADERRRRVEQATQRPTATSTEAVVRVIVRGHGQFRSAGAFGAFVEGVLLEAGLVVKTSRRGMAGELEEQERRVVEADRRAIAEAIRERATRLSFVPGRILDNLADDIELGREREVAANG